MPTIVIFDIDGTLTNTRSYDETSYEQALYEVFGFTLSLEDRRMLKGSADSGLLIEICELFRGKLPTAKEEAYFKEAFFYHLEDRLKQNQELQINGASQLLLHLSSLSNIHMGIATGAWRESALLKLKYAGIGFEMLDITSADDGVSKDDILCLALAKLRKKSERGIQSYYIGDRHFDFLASKRLDMGFIGIGNDENLLEHIENNYCLQDLANIEHFLKLISYE